MTNREPRNVSEISAGASPREENSIPLFGRWRNAYLAVTLIFVLEVALFYFVSHHFS